MSWDATLYADGEEVLWQNYTHNVNGMIAAAYEAVSGEGTEQASGPLGAVIGAAWWKRLDGTSGEEGAAYLSRIIEGLEGAPERYRAMNPPNGWGDYDSLLGVLRKMRDAAAGISGPGLWHVSG